MKPDANKIKKTKRELNKDGHIRIPRPLGLTLLCQRYQNTQSPNPKQEIKDIILKRTIEEYILNGMTYQGKVYTLEQMAYLLDTEPKDLMIRMNKGIARFSNLIMGEDGRQFARAGILKAFFEVQQGTSMARAQAHLLYNAQGGEYVPFISAEATKAIQVWLNAGKPLIDLLRLLVEPAGNGQTIINNNLTQTTANNLLTATEAINLIKSEGMKSLIEDTSYELIDGKLKELPEVRAQYQDLSKIGIKSPIKGKDGQIDEGGTSSHYKDKTKRQELLGGEILDD